jgi:tetratricopeptide (TPR) repeat protein
MMSPLLKFLPLIIASFLNSNALFGSALQLNLGTGTQWGEWQEAKAFYDTQKFQEALQSLENRPNETFSYYYNLGTIYYQLGRIGPSVAFLTKANRLRPHDADIKHNLSIAVASLSRSIGEERLDPASTWLEDFGDRASGEEAKTALGLMCILILLFWTRNYLRSRNLKSLFWHPTGWIGICIFLATIAVPVIQKWASTHPAAICLESQIVRSGPGDRFIELAQVPAGSKLRIIDGNNPETPTKGTGWRQIRYSENEIGWVRASGLLVL